MCYNYFILNKAADILSVDFPNKTTKYYMIQGLKGIGVLCSEAGKEVVRIGLTGVILKKRYCILEQIGKGGGGHLYLARDMELGKVWAVKELPLARKQEASLLRQLNHPFLPKMVDYVELEEHCYLVMEYIQGKSLGVWKQEGRAFSCMQILKYALDISEILIYLHSRKPPLYYGDLKPDNLMLTEHDVLYLVDMGSAVAGYEGYVTVCSGTPGFAAPEQYEGRISQFSDIYALGKTMKALFGKKAGFLWLNHLELWLFLEKCTRKKEKNRYRNMEVVKRKLQILREKERSRRKKVCSKVAEVAILCAFVLLLCFWTGQKRDFWKDYGQVTNFYYQEEFLHGDTKQKRAVCLNVEKKLQKLLQQYRKKEEQRQLLLLLGINGELLKEKERTCIYYEQLLLYDPDYAAAYGEYGMFLLRCNQMEKSKELWQAYKKRKIEGTLEKDRNRNLKLWEEYMDE